MNEAEKGLLFHTLAMLTKLESERAAETQPEKSEILFKAATLLQDVGIRLGGSMEDIQEVLLDGKEMERRLGFMTGASIKTETEQETH